MSINNYLSVTFSGKSGLEKRFVPLAIFNIILKAALSS